MSAELVDAWREAAADLGIKVRVHGDALVVQGFGSENGMLCAIPTDSEGERELQREAESYGMGWSVLTRSYAQYERIAYIDMLTLYPFRPLDFGGDAAWTDSPAVACAATSELWRRDSHTGSAFVTVSTAASIMGPFFTLPRCSLRMR